MMPVNMSKLTKTIVSEKNRCVVVAFRYLSDMDCQNHGRYLSGVTDPKGIK